jgi:hypothetical protein
LIGPARHAERHDTPWNARNVVHKNVSICFPLDDIGGPSHSRTPEVVADAAFRWWFAGGKQSETLADVPCRFLLDSGKTPS